MRLEVKGRNVEVNDSIRRYAEEKLERVERQLPEATQIEVELTLETNPSISARSHRRGDGLDEGVDPACPRELERVRDLDRPALGQARAPGEALPREAEPARDRSPRERAQPDEPSFSGEQLDRMIVKSKQFELQPLDAGRGGGRARADRARLLRLHERRDRPDERRLPPPCRRVRSDRATGLDWASSGATGRCTSSWPRKAVSSSDLSQARRSGRRHGWRGSCTASRTAS